MIYVDSSMVVAILLREIQSPKWSARFKTEKFYSSRLLEAEVLAALRREKLPLSEFDDHARMIYWIAPERSLKPEVTKVLEYQYLRGADLWHVACALYIFGNSTGVEFCSLDKIQRAAAKACGFRLLPEKL